MKTNLIGISGKAGSGKNTVADIIQFLIWCKKNPGTSDGTFNFPLFQKWSAKAKETSGWTQKSFAGKLKQIASILTGIPVEKFENQEFKKNFLPPEWNYIATKPSKRQDGLFGGEKYNKLFQVREFLQKLGTEAIRNQVHPNAWVNALFADYNKGSQCNCIVYQESQGCYHCDYTGYDIIPSKWLITDVRFPNEYKAIKDRGGIIIRVNRPFVPKEYEEAEVKVFSNWTTIIYSHTDSNGYHYGISSDGYKYKSDLIRAVQTTHPSETALDEYEFDYSLFNTGTISDLIKAVKTTLDL